MQNSKVDTIQVIPTSEGELILLPTRKIRKLWFHATGNSLFFLIFIGLGSIPILMGFKLPGNDSTTVSSQPIDWFPVIFGSVFCLIAILMIYHIIFTAGSTDSIELKDEWLILSRRFGPIRRRKKVALRKIHGFTISSDESKLGAKRKVIALNRLEVSLTNGRSKNVTWGYPRSTLQQLALLLKKKCEVRADTISPEGQKLTIAIEERTQNRSVVHAKYDEEGGQLDIAPRPSNAISTIDYHQDGLTITCPPVGVWRGSKGAFLLAILWNTFIPITLWLEIKQALIAPQSASFSSICVLGLFFAIGIFLAVFCINAGYRRAEIAVAGDTLLLSEQSLFKKKHHEVHRNNIKTLRRESSGAEVNEDPILNLQIHTRQGQKIALLSQLSDEEIAWIASELRKALRIDC